MKTAKLATLMPGAQIMYRERLATVLEHAHGGVFVQLNDALPARKFGKNNNWRDSALRKHLNGEFAQLLTEGNLEELLETVTDLTAMDGMTDYGATVDKVTLLTFDQCRKYRYIRPLPTEWEWTSTPASTPSGWDEEARYAWYVSTNGGSSDDSCSSSYGIRPALVLPSSLLVKVQGCGGLEEYSDADLLSELLKRRRDV